MERDPVCGMKVDETTATFSARYGEQAYHFCAQGCLLAFAKEPEKYVAQAGRPLHIELPRDVSDKPDAPLIRVHGLRKIYQRGKEEVATLRGLQMEAMGMTMEPQLTQAIALRALGLTAVISLLAGGYPALLAARLNLAEALRGE
jgi:YHS domain-containing protein